MPCMKEMMMMMMMMIIIIIIIIIPFGPRLSGPPRDPYYRVLYY